MRKVMWLDQKGRRKLMAAVFVSLAAVSASLAANTAYSSVKDLFDCYPSTATYVELGLAFIFTLTTVWLAFKAYTKLVSHRLKTRSKNLPVVDVLVLPVSKPGRDTSSAYHKDTMLSDVLKFASGTYSGSWGVHGLGSQSASGYQCLSGFRDPRLWLRTGEDDHRFSAFTWQTGFATVDESLRETGLRQLKAIHLVPSEGASGESTGEIARHFYAPILKALINAQFARSTCERRAETRLDLEELLSQGKEKDVLQVIVHEGVRYYDFEHIQQKLRWIIDYERNRFGRGAKFNFDVTGGTTGFSTVAAIESAEENISFSFVGQDESAKIFAYDVVTDELRV